MKDIWNMKKTALQAAAVGVLGLGLAHAQALAPVTLPAETRAIPQGLGDGQGSVTADLGTLDQKASPIRGAIRVQPYDCTGAFAGLQEVKFQSKDGLRLATNEHVVPRKGKLNQQETEAEADAFIAKKVLPKGLTLVRQPTGLRTKEKFDSQGRQISNEVVGYLVSYSEFYEGIKLGESIVNISFSDQDMMFVSARLYDLIEPATEKKAGLKSMAALTGHLADIKGRLGIGASEKYEVGTAELCYVPDNETGIAAGPVQTWAPAWHYIVKVDPGTPGIPVAGTIGRHVWVNAENGNLIRVQKQR
ncbi:MAG: hypothetical protein JWO82_2242 [Akkermansiaceae bacterium]|nr:hypothetical protein [Akkermansiaceae bacterium]